MLRFNLTNLAEESLQDLKTYMPHCEWLHLNHNRFTNSGMAHIAQLQHLRELNLWNQNITEDFIDMLAEAKSPINSLTIISCFKVNLDLVMQKIGQFSGHQIHRLDLEEGKNLVTDYGLTSLKENKSLPIQLLFISGHQVTFHGIEMLKENCPEIELCLNGRFVDFNASLRDSKIVFQ